MCDIVMEMRIIIKNFVIMGMLIGVLFFSQSSVFVSKAQEFSQPIIKRGQGYVNNQKLSNASAWFENNILDKFFGIGGGVQMQKEVLQSNISEKVDDVKGDSFYKAKEFAAKKVLQILGVKGVECELPSTDDNLNPVH